MSQLSLPAWVLPVLFAVSVGGAFAAGRYTAEFDAAKRQAEMARFLQASASADQLRLYASLLSQIRSGESDGAVRVLEYQAHAQTAGAAECLSNQVCAQLAAATPDKQVTLRELISAHAASPFSTK